MVAIGDPSATASGTAATLSGSPTAASSREATHSREAAAKSGTAPLTPAEWPLTAAGQPLTVVEQPMNVAERSSIAAELQPLLEDGVLSLETENKQEDWELQTALPVAVPHEKTIFQSLTAPGDALVAVTGILGAACESSNKRTPSLTTADP